MDRGSAILKIILFNQVESKLRDQGFGDIFWLLANRANFMSIKIWFYRGQIPSKFGRVFVIFKYIMK